MTHPLIAITPQVGGPPGLTGRAAVCETAYSDCIQAVGGLPVIVPLTTHRSTLEQILSRCHGLLLTGGGDVCEMLYHRPLTEGERATLSGCNEVRDQMEMLLTRAALLARVPVLGICRGMQLLNLAAGGTLIPDIRLARPDAIRHRTEGAGPVMHPVTWDMATNLGDLMGARCATVNSTHHQAVDRPAPGFKVAARATDGIIEAVEMPGETLVAGVQFHPERMVNGETMFLRLFALLVESARHAGS
jgi:putative glutamine amidotransferase